MKSLPFRPTQCHCVQEKIELSTETMGQALALFVDQRLTRCSQEHFHLTYEEAMAREGDDLESLKKAIFSAVLNEMLIEVIAERVLRAQDALSAAPPPV